LGHDPRVVDEDIDSAVGLDGGVHEPLHLVELGHVGRDSSGSPAGGGQFLRQRSYAVDPACAEDDDCAERGKVACGGFAETAAGAGDDDDLAVDVRGHGVFRAARARL
jgi:hypothetical protein